MVKPEMVTMPLVMRNTRLALLPLMDSMLAPGPRIARFLLLMNNSPLVSVIVPVTTFEKMIVSPDDES